MSTLQQGQSQSRGPASASASSLSKSLPPPFRPVPVKPASATTTMPTLSPTLISSPSSTAADKLSTSTSAADGGPSRVHAPPSSTTVAASSQPPPPPSTTTTTAAAATNTTTTNNTTATTTAPVNPIHNALPTTDQQAHIPEARAALVASLGNLLDTELQSRATLLHGNAAALERQERDVARATDGLRRENDKLARWSADGARRVKELGNVQNWAEVMEREFLVLEETMRIVREGSDSARGSGRSSRRGSGSGSWCSCSDDDCSAKGAWRRDRSGEEVEEDEEEGGMEGSRGGGVKLESKDADQDLMRDDKGDIAMKIDDEDMESGGAKLEDQSGLDKGKGRDLDLMGMQTDSESLAEAESSNDTDGRAKGSDTTSLSTMG